MNKEIKLKPCRKCNSTDFDLWDGRGTQAEMGCNDCGDMDSLQVSDLLSQEERYSGAHDFSMETLSYPAATVALAQKALAEEWNKRAKSPIEAQLQAEVERLRGALKRIVSMEFFGNDTDLALVNKLLIRIRETAKAALQHNEVTE